MSSSFWSYFFGLYNDAIQGSVKNPKEKVYEFSKLKRSKQICSLPQNKTKCLFCKNLTSCHIHQIICKICILKVGNFECEKSLMYFALLCRRTIHYLVGVSALPKMCFHIWQPLLFSIFLTYLSGKEVDNMSFRYRVQFEPGLTKFLEKNGPPTDAPHCNWQSFALFSPLSLSTEIF